MPSLDSYLPHPHVRERFARTVQAPAPLVMRTAYDYDLQSIGLIRTIIRTRKLLKFASGGIGAACLSRKGIFSLRHMPCLAC